MPDGLALEYIYTDSVFVSSVPQSWLCNAENKNNHLLTWAVKSIGKANIPSHTWRIKEKHINLLQTYMHVIHEFILFAFLWPCFKKEIIYLPPMMQTCQTIRIIK